MHQAMEMDDKLASDRVCTEELEIPCGNGGEMRALLLRPLEKTENAPSVLWLHGGGYVIGSPEYVFAGSMAEDLVAKGGCITLVPDYRLAIETPYPAALEDSYTALLWLRDHAAELGANPSQLFIGGESAGAGLCVAVCLLARDRKEVQIAFQMPLYPMLDDRMETESMKDNNAPCWNMETNRNAWRMYLGELYGKNVPVYAAPARETNYAGLPPAATFVGSVDPFRDETLQYCKNLIAAGIPVDLEVYEGCFHGFDMIFPHLEISKQAKERILQAYLHAAEHYFK